LEPLPPAVASWLNLQFKRDKLKPQTIWRRSTPRREKSIRTPAKEGPLLLIQFCVRRWWASFDAASFVCMFMCNRIRNHCPALSFHTEGDRQHIIQCGVNPRLFLCVLKCAAKKTWQSVRMMAQQRTELTEAESKGRMRSKVPK
jgi:hypothetical protein